MYLITVFIAIKFQQGLDPSCFLTKEHFRCNGDTIEKSEIALQHNTLLLLLPLPRRPERATRGIPKELSSSSSLTDVGVGPLVSATRGSG